MVLDCTPTDSTPTTRRPSDLVHAPRSFILTAVDADLDALRRIAWWIENAAPYYVTHAFRDDLNRIAALIQQTTTERTPETSTDD